MMWTYRHPYKPLNATPDSIRYHAQAELFRAVNTGRTIAFVGSGMTTPYGRLTWRNFARVAVIEADGKYAELKGQGSASVTQEATSIRRSIWQILRQTGPGADPGEDRPIPICYKDDVPPDVGLLQLCEDMLYALGQPEFLRQITAGIFRASSAGKFRLRILILKGRTASYLALESLLGGDDEKLHISEFVREHPEPDQDRIVENLKRFDWREALRHAELKRLVDLEIDHAALKDEWRRFLKQFVVEPEGIVQGFEPRFDTIKEVFDRFRIRHYLTLNYDNEIERFFERYRFYEGEAADQTKDAEEKEIQQWGPFGQRLKVDIVDETRLSALAEFAILPAASKTSIIHAHGRVDRRDSLVITERDYQIRYLHSNASRQAFDEALTMLFRGNHILFLGIGMSETDLLRPLRQFMADRDGLRRTGASAVAVMAGDRIRFDRARVDGNGLEIIRSDGDENLVTDVRSSELKVSADQALKAITLHSQYGVKSFHADAQIREDYPKDCGQLAALNHDLDSSDNDTRLLLRALKTLEHRRIRWWRNWNRIPEPRRALFSTRHVAHDDGGTMRIWVRQQILPDANEIMEPGPDFDAGADDAVENARSPIEHIFALAAKAMAEKSAIPRPEPEFRIWMTEREDNPGFAGAREVTSAAEPVRAGPRVLRLQVPDGIGKGSIFRALQRNAGNLFATDEDEQHGPCLTGFFADTRFSAEFNSVVFGMIRFLVGIQEYEDSAVGANGGRPPEDEGDEAQIVDHAEEAKGLADGSTAILDLLEAEIRKTAEKLSKREADERILLCFNGVDQLADSEGMIRNGLHRLFFRILLGRDRDGKVRRDVGRSPFDIVLISSRSNQALKDISAEDATDGGWHRIRPAPLGDRRWLGPASRRIQVIARLIGDKIVDDQQPEARDERFELTEQGETYSLMKSALGKVMLDNTAIDHFCRSYVDCYLSDRSEQGQSEDARESDLRRRLRQINHAAHSSAQSEVIAAVLAAYHDLHVGARSNLYERRRWALQQVILRHLVYFPIPVERCVLAACPDIRSVMLKLFDREVLGQSDGAFAAGLARLDLTQRPGDVRALGEGKKHLNGEALTAYHQIDDGLEHVCVRFLEEFALGPLVRQGLVIPVRASGQIRPSRGDASGPLQSGQRYTLHRALREHLGREMGYPMTSRHYSHAYDVSLYSAESGDRPAPNVDAFMTVAQILEAIVRRVQEGLNAFAEVDEGNSRYMEHEHAQVLKEIGEELSVGSNLPTQTDLRETLASRNLRHQDGGEAFEFTSYREQDTRLFDFAYRTVRNKMRSADANGRLEQLVPSLDSPHSFTRLIRAAASLITAGFPIQTMSRLRRVDLSKLRLGESDQALELYNGWIRGLLNATITLELQRTEIQRRFNKVVPLPREDHSDVRLPLYRSELIWLYNERALVSHVQGHMDDSRALFRIAVGMAKDWRWAEEFGEHASPAMASMRGIRLNQAIARMEAGKLKSAARRLEELLVRRQRIRGSGRSLVLELANGWMGINDYYRGNFARAEQKLTETLTYLQTVPDNLRGISIFRRFLALTWYRMGRDEEALKRMDLSIEAANAGDHRDLVYLSVCAKARMLVDMDRDDDTEENEAIMLIDKVEDYAQRMGAPRLEMLSKMARAASMAKRNHLEQAGQLLGEAIAIANLQGLEIHKAVALSYYATVLRQRAAQKARDGADDLRLAEKIEEANEFNCAVMGFALSLHKPRRVSA